MNQIKCSCSIRLTRHREPSHVFLETDEWSPNRSRSLLCISKKSWFSELYRYRYSSRRCVIRVRVVASSTNVIQRLHGPKTMSHTPWPAYPSAAAGRLCRWDLFFLHYSIRYWCRETPTLPNDIVFSWLCRRSSSGHFLSGVISIRFLLLTKVNGQKENQCQLFFV